LPQALFTAELQKARSFLERGFYGIQRLPDLEQFSHLDIRLLF